MTTTRRWFGIGPLCLVFFTIAACGGSGTGDAGADGPGGQSAPPTPPPSGSTGFFNLSISDGPIKDASKVCVRFDGVELKHADSEDRETINFDQPKVVNLLAHQGANSAPIVTGAEVPAGEYEWVRLKVQAERGLGGGANDGDPTSDVCDSETENSYLVRDSGDLNNLFIPSGSQRGLQLIKDIVIPANRSGDYTAEWDLGKSFNGPPGLLPDVMMKPVVKLVANNEVGTLEGQVADALIDLASCDAEFAPSVYVFDDGVEPNPLPIEDEEFAEDDAVATGLVEQQMLDDGSMPWLYSIGFLLSGDYEVAYTCNGTDFTPLDGKPAEILVDEVTTVDFALEDASGTLTGQVDAAFFDPEAPESGFCEAEVTPAVYVFEDGVLPNFESDPIATGVVAMDMSTEQYAYSIALQGGNYNAAFTCSTFEFFPADGKPAEILPAETTTVDFLAEDAPAPVGSLTGTVAAELATATSCNADFQSAVYVFDDGTVPSADVEPVATGSVSMSGEVYEYLIEELVADSYEAAFTCNGADFAPENGKEALITIGETKTLDFVAEDAPASE